MLSGGIIKDGDTLKQINVVFLVNQRTGCPLYYRVFSGSTPDVSTVSHLLKEYARLDLNRMAIMVADTTTDSNGNTVVNNKKKFEYMLNKGIRVLVSDIVSDPVEAHRAYQERNGVEMSFRKLKDFTGARRLNISSSKTLRGKMFVHFISCSILCMLRSRINSCKDKGITLPYDSEVKMLAALSNITQSVFSNGGYFSEVIGKKETAAR